MLQFISHLILFRGKLEVEVFWADLLERDYPGEKYELSLYFFLLIKIIVPRYRPGKNLMYRYVRYHQDKIPPVQDLEVNRTMYLPSIFIEASINGSFFVVLIH